jgi:Flp pilus assembly protein CpaB
MRNILFILVGLALAIGGAYYIVTTYIPTTEVDPQEALPQHGTRILVLTVNKNFQERLRATELEARDWPDGAVTENMLVISPTMTDDEITTFKRQYENYYVTVDNIPPNFPLLKSYISRTQPIPPDPPNTSQVLVFRAAKAYGDQFYAGDLDVKNWPDEAVDPGMLVVGEGQQPEAVKAQFNGWYITADAVPPGFPVMNSTISVQQPAPKEVPCGPGDARPECQVAVAPPTGTTEDIGITPAVCDPLLEECPVTGEAVVETPPPVSVPGEVRFDLSEFGAKAYEVAIAEEVRVNVILDRPASVMGAAAGTGGTTVASDAGGAGLATPWRVSEPILTNVRLERREHPDYKPLGVAFFAQLDPEQAKRFELARAIGQTHIELVSEQTYNHVNHFCMGSRCYEQTAITSRNLESIPETALPGFNEPPPETDILKDSDFGPAAPSPLDTPFADVPEPNADGLPQAGVDPAAPPLDATGAEPVVDPSLAPTDDPFADPGANSDPGLNGDPGFDPGSAPPPPADQPVDPFAVPN